MQRTLMVGKIHRATVTHADLHYVGSLTIDANLMKAANIVEGERVQIVDITNGARLETYAITGEPDSGTIGINGAAARLVHPGDLVIIITYGLFDDNEVDAHRPTVIHVDEHNRQVDIGDDPAEPVPGALNQYNGRR